MRNYYKNTLCMWHDNEVWCFLLHAVTLCYHEMLAFCTSLISALSRIKILSNAWTATQCAWAYQLILIQKYPFHLYANLLGSEGVFWYLHIHLMYDINGDVVKRKGNPELCPDYDCQGEKEQGRTVKTKIVIDANLQLEKTGKDNKKRAFMQSLPAIAKSYFGPNPI